MIWSYQPHQACNPFFKLSQIVGYSDDWIDSICFDPGFIGLVLKNTGVGGCWYTVLSQLTLLTWLHQAKLTRLEPIFCNLTSIKAEGCVL